MKKKVWIGIGIAVLVIALICLNVYRTNANDQIAADVTKLKQEEISATVMTPGTLKLSSEQTVYYNSEHGEINEILVKKGDKVEKGTPLIRYKNEMLELEKEQNDLQVESLYVKINNLDKQKKRLNEKEKELEAQIGKKEAEKTLEPEFSQLDMDTRMTNIELKQALLQKDVIKKKLAALEIKSKINGIVLDINQFDELEQHELTTKPILRLGNTESLLVEGVISEYDTLKVKVGQVVKLRSDVMPDKEWKGKVLEVSYLPIEQAQGLDNPQSAVQYPILVSVLDKNIELKPGFQIIMDIETEKHTALTLPLGAIKQKENRQVVYVVEDGKAVEKEIKVGVATNENIEVVSGLKQNESVILNPPESIKDGMEVTIE